MDDNGSYDALKCSVKENPTNCSWEYSEEQVSSKETI